MRMVTENDLISDHCCHVPDLHATLPRLRRPKGVRHASGGHGPGQAGAIQSLIGVSDGAATVAPEPGAIQVGSGWATP